MKPIPFNALANLLGQKSPNQELVCGVAIDSRNVRPNDLFFALPGSNVDGHAFVADAASKGAIGAVVEENYRGEHPIPLIHVPDVLLAMQDFARKSLEKRSSKVIAITGSIGKTTTKEFIATLLGAHFRIFASPRSYNTQSTVPLSILMAEGDEEYLILEMGMTHAGQIKKLISIAPPDIALLTTIAVQHASNFSDGLIGIAREKAAVFSHPKTQLGIFHHDIQHYAEVCKIGGYSKKSFSIASENADYFLKLTKERVRIYTRGELSCDIPLLHLPLKVHYQNFLAAVAVARSLEIPWPLIQEAARSLKLPSMRFEKIEKQGILFVNDAYNANPDSMKAALEGLPKPQAGGKVIAVLSEMDALGNYSEEGHRDVAKTALHYADCLLCLGARCESMYAVWKEAAKSVEIFTCRADLEACLKKNAQPGDVVLLKGARAYALDQILSQF